MFDRLTRIVAPAGAILTVDEGQEHLRADGDEELIEALIAAATAVIEGPNGIGIALLTQTWRLSLDCLKSRINLPLGPVQSVESVTYTDVAGDVQTLDEDLYGVDLDSDPARIFRKPFLTYPENLPSPGSVKVVMVCGFGDAATDVPADLRHAALMLVSHFYENREATSTLKLEKVPFGVETILNRYRVVPVA